jgi:glucan phosphoethanolaminetransferase (alkaline phosphatase superfamily)
MTRSGRAVTFILMFVLNLVTIAPSLAPSALYLPQLATFARGAGAIYLVAIATACAFLLLGVLRGFLSLTFPMTRMAVPIAAALLIGLSLLSLAASAFYTRFAAYPALLIARHVVTDPSDSIDYAKSSATAGDLVLLAVLAAVEVALAVVVTRRVSREPIALHRAVFNTLLGTALLWAFHAAPIHGDAARLLLADHSLPAAKYLYDLGSLLDSNRVEMVRQYVPRAPIPEGPVDVSKAHHVVLIIAECLRADHLPAYGYARSTTPFIDSEADKWVVFQRAYSHGSATAESFPPLFNSQYFAAVSTSNEGSSSVWRYLHERGIGSAFLSASAMEWGAITNSIAVSQMDHGIVASTGPAERWGSVERRFDFTVDDSIPLNRYVELLKQEFGRRPSFAAVHFVGSHYPFRYSDTADVFLPSMRQPLGAAGEGVERIRNSFDNSIIHIDNLVRQVVRALEELGIADDSVVVLTADHGESLGEHRSFFHGTTLYDEQVHVPLLVRVGSRLQQIRKRLEQRRSTVVGHVDLVPTILHILSGRSPVGEPFEGVSLLTAAQKPYELLLYRGVGEKVAFVTRDRKFIFDLEGRRAEEYALIDDPGEQHNLWQGNERRVAQFTAALVKRAVLPDAAR